jgi:hypothetical protein
MSYKFFGQTINGSASVLYGTHHFAFGVEIPDPVIQNHTSFLSLVYLTLYLQALY